LVDLKFEISMDPSLFLTDAYRVIYRDKLRLSDNLVLETFQKPSKRQYLENGITLSLKEFSDDHLTYLLVGSQLNDNRELLAFAYWIPKDIINLKLSLVDNLEVFANRFGCKIKISTSDGFFLRKVRKLILGRLDNINDCVEILGSVHIPCDLYTFYNENPGYKLNWVDFTFSFAISDNKYLVWLYGVETIQIIVQSDWFDFLSEIKDVLNPFGKTGLSILAKKKKAQDGIESYKSIDHSAKSLVEMQIPKSYTKSFEAITVRLSELKSGDRILIVPKFENNKCVFCGSMELSKEHIFAKWMRGYFDEKTFHGEVYTRLPNDDLLDTLKSGVSKGSQSSYGYTMPNVCVDCNRTWMSRLEEDAKNILSIDSKSLKSKVSDLELDESKAKKLALWVSVKAILLAIKSNIGFSIPSDDVKLLKDGILSNKFLIEVTDVGIYNLNYAVSNGPHSFGSSLLRLKVMEKKNALELAWDLFIVTIQIGNFLFRISYYDESKGLVREGCIKPTTVIFPFEKEIPYFKIEDDEERWEAILDNLKFNIFCMGISLTEG